MSRLSSRLQLSPEKKRNFNFRVAVHEENNSCPKQQKEYGWTQFFGKQQRCERLKIQAKILEQEQSLKQLLSRELTYHDRNILNKIGKLCLVSPMCRRFYELFTYQYLNILIDNLLNTHVRTNNQIFYEKNLPECGLKCTCSIRRFFDPADVIGVRHWFEVGSSFYKIIDIYGIKWYEFQAVSQNIWSNRKCPKW